MKKMGRTVFGVRMGLRRQLLLLYHDLCGAHTAMLSIAAAEMQYLYSHQPCRPSHTGLRVLTRGPSALCLLCGVTVRVLARDGVGMFDLLCPRHGVSSALFRR
jgi:hypothetical protein